MQDTGARNRAGKQDGTHLRSDVLRRAAAQDTSLINDITQHRNDQTRSTRGIALPTRVP